MKIGTKPTMNNLIMCILINLAVLCWDGRCSTPVEQTPHDSDIMGSNPAGCWALNLLYPISSASLIRSLAEGHHN